MFKGCFCLVFFGGGGVPTLIFVILNFLKQETVLVVDLPVHLPTNWLLGTVIYFLWLFLFNLFLPLCSIFICNIYEFLELGFIHCYEVILYFIYTLSEIHDNELLTTSFAAGLFLIIKLCTGRLCQY